MVAGDFKQSPNLVGKILSSGQVAGAAATTIYTVPAASAVKISTFSLSNVTGSAVVVSVSVVPAGASIDATHVVLSTYSLAAHDVITSEDVLSMLKGAMLEAGALISVTPGTVTAINYLLTGAVSS